MTRCRTTQTCEVERRMSHGVRAVLVALIVLAVLLSVPLHAQQPGLTATEALARRVGQRIEALQREADRLANEAGTLVGDLRQLEVERDLQGQRLKVAQQEVLEADAALLVTTERIGELERTRVAQIPDLRAQLVDVYKRRRGGYARLVLEADTYRELARVVRSVTALTGINAERAMEHRETLETLLAQQTTLGKTAVEQAAAEAETRRAQAAVERAISERTALIARIDARRDLSAQLAGELQVANERLERQLTNLAAGRASEPVTVPIGRFRGGLDWPVEGPVAGRFGQPTTPDEGSPLRSGIEIARATDTRVGAVHGGGVAYADPFEGFGTLVILDHGTDSLSVYGYLASTSVEKGQVLQAGGEVGRVGFKPGAPPALYFEMRIDGRSVDPLQWLRSP